MNRLKDEIAIVTGASSGIGAAVARLFAKEGAAVVLAHHDHADDARRIVGEIEAAGGRAVEIGGDVRDGRAVVAVFAKAREAFGDPTLLVNSAGVDAAGIPVADMEADHFVDVLKTNLLGPFLFCRAFMRARREAGGGGAIINVTSVHEDVPRSGAGDYCASKGGLRMLTRCLALEGADLRITANNLAPGMVLTPMNQEALDDPEKLKEQVASIPLKRAAEPEEMAALALYMAADASYATGTTFFLDGGLRMNLGQGA